MADKSGIRILIVEDNPSDAEIILHEIKRAGMEFESLRIETEDDFLSALRDFNPDIILSDFQLPSFNGMTALKLTLEKAPLIPFLLITGSLSEEMAVDFMKAGASDYILKEHIHQLSPALITALRKKEVLEEKARAEKALRESEERFRMFAQLAPAAILIYQDDTWIYANPAAEAITGYSAKELFKMRFWDFVHPEFRNIIRDRGRDQMKGKPQPSRYEIKIVCKSGREIWVDVTSGLIMIEGKPAIIASAIDTTERKASEASIRASLEEKEILLREIHHRVKNNMQVIISLLNLQGRNISDPVALEMLRDSQRRIHSMALVHEKLYQSKDFSRINVASYVQGLVAHVFHSYQADSSRIAFEPEIEDISLDINTMIPCGLIINELVSNALKHAFPQGTSGRVRVSLKKAKNGKYELTVADDGAGLPKGFDFEKAETLGLQLVVMLVDQLDGTLTRLKGKGTAFRIEFGELAYKPRF
jgi:PAS domain S-box-containing protein